MSTQTDSAATMTQRRRACPRKVRAFLRASPNKSADLCCRPKCRAPWEVNYLGEFPLCSRHLELVYDERNRHKFMVELPAGPPKAQGGAP
jgi:hypothetical protein